MLTYSHLLHQRATTCPEFSQPLSQSGFGAVSQHHTLPVLFQKPSIAGAGCRDAARCDASTPKASVCHHARVSSLGLQLSGLLGRIPGYSQIQK